MSRILDKHALLKKLSKYKLALQKSISIKNKLFSDFINKKDLTQKTELHITGFSLLEGWGKSSHQPKICSSLPLPPLPPPTKFLFPSHKRSIPPTQNKNFHIKIK